MNRISSSAFCRDPGIQLGQRGLRGHAFLRVASDVDGFWARSIRTLALKTRQGVTFDVLQ
jgi:hypothetical protein